MFFKILVVSGPARLILRLPRVAPVKEEVGESVSLWLVYVNILLFRFASLILFGTISDLLASKVLLFQDIQSNFPHPPSSAASSRPASSAATAPNSDGRGKVDWLAMLPSLDELRVKADEMRAAREQQTNAPHHPTKVYIGFLLKDSRSLDNCE